MSARTSHLMNLEWYGHLIVREVPERWSLIDLTLARPTLGQVLVAIPDDSDRILASLVTLVQHGDALATRLLLQALLPKLVTFATTDVADFDDYLASLWLVARSYPLARRPYRIAANLALDARRLVRLGWRPGPSGTPYGRRGDPYREARAATDRLLAAARDRGLIDETAQVLLRSVYREGFNSAETARRAASTPTSVRWRCSKAVQMLQRHRDVLVDDMRPW